MLLVQKICLQWDKEERGAKGENVRRQFPQAYVLEKLPIRNKEGVFAQSRWDSYTSEWHTKYFQDCMFVHNLYFYQKKELILDAVQYEHDWAERYRSKLGWESERIAREIQDRIAWIKRYQYDFGDIMDVNKFGNISICSKADKYEVSYMHYQGVVPIRRGHNKDYHNINSPFYQKDLLNETAFILSPDQYGRIIWNERKTDYDTGEWYYQLHIFNLLYLSNKTVQKDSFIQKEPDYLYKQLAHLY